MKSMKFIKSMKSKFNSGKKFLCAAVILLFAVLPVILLTSCEKADFYNLAQNLLKDGGKANGSLYSFTANLNITINKNYLYNAGISYDFKDAQFDVIPDSLKFTFDGKVKNDPSDASKTVFEITAALNNNQKTVIYGKNNTLYFELNDESKIVLDFLSATGFFDPAIKNIVENQISYDKGTVIYFNFSDINLLWFDRYTAGIDNALKLTSGVQYGGADSIKDFSVPDLDKSKAVWFGDIKSRTDTELLKIPKYRYAELSVVLSSENNGKDNYLNILATRENGKTDLFEKIKIDYDISKIRKDNSLLYSADILPMRYILELLGETVNWDGASKKAYITDSGGKKIYFNGTLVNSKTYISLTQLITNTSYQIDVGSIGNYVEFKIDRPQS